MAQTIEELVEILDNMKLEAGRNAESFDKLLTTINNKIEFMANDTEANDIIKLYLTELKKTLEERASFVTSEFSKIEESFKSLNDENANLIKTSEMKEMFDIFSRNMQSIALELSAQKELLAQYDERFSKFVSDKADRNEIVASVSEIKKDIEIINHGFELSISDINTNIQSIFKNLVVMDPTAQNDIVRRELENVYLSTNTILTALHSIEQKNDDLMQNFDKFITRENFEQSQEKLDFIIEKAAIISSGLEKLPNKDDYESISNKTSEISEKLNSLPQHDDLRYFAGKADELSEQIISLPQKEDIASIVAKTTENLQEKFDEISQNKKIDEIYSKADEISEKLLPLAEKSDIDNLVNHASRISEKFDSVANKEDLDAITASTAEISKKIDALPNQENMSDLSENIHKFSDLLDVLKTNIASANENTSLMVREQLDKLHGVLSAVVTENDFTGFRQDLTDFIQRIIANTGILNENLSLNKETLQQLIAKIEALDVHKDVETVADVLGGLRQTSLNNVEKIIGEIGNVSSKIDNFSTGNLETKLDGLNGAIENAEQNIKLLQNEMLEKLSDNSDSEKFNNLDNSIEFLKETMLSAQASNEANITEKLLALRDMITSNVETRDEKFLDLQGKLNEFISNAEKISNEAEIRIGNSISEITGLKSDIENISKEFAGLNYNQDDRDAKIVNLISAELEDIGLAITTLKESVQTGVHQELSKNSEIVENQINNLLTYIDNLKSEMQTKSQEEPVYETVFKELKDKITAVKQEINLVNTDIIDALNSRAEAIMLELSPLKDTFELFSSTGENIEAKFANMAESQSKLIELAILELKNLIEEKLEVLNPDSYEQEYLTSIADDIKETLGDKIKSGTEDLKNMLSVAMNNDDVTWAIDNLKDDLSDKVKRIFDERNNLSEVLEKTDEISNGNVKITELLDALNSKVDTLAASGADGDVMAEINEVKTLISSQKSLIETSVSEDKMTEVESTLKELLTKIETIESSDLKDMRETIITAILNVFEQISFIEETEEIKDFVEEKTDEISRSLTEVKQQLKQIVNTDDGYSYTLQDVESDIAKLRLVLNELSNTSSNEEISDISENIHRIVTSVEDLQNSLTQEQISELKNDFEKLSEDVLSISSRTNRLLLTSDESYNALSSGLNDFSNVIYKLEERINYLDNKEITERIEQKLDGVANVVTGSANSDKVMRQAFMYMGEWIDTASENLESLCEKSDKIDEVQDAVAALQEKMPEQTDLLNTIVERFEEQQERIDRLELTLEKILSAIDDIDDSKIIKKVDKVDKQLAKLSNTIEKLASYVDE